jgi:hypothetical protein
MFDVDLANEWNATVTSAPSTTGTVGETYSYTLVANESVTLALSGNATSWMTLTGMTVSGRPTNAQNYSVSLAVTSVNGTGTTYVNWTITVGPSPYQPLYDMLFPIAGIFVIIAVLVFLVGSSKRVT